ncbi:MAG: sigma factor-like helix-turn-helix DNA-binding protein [Egibacteraceae bacterium]
MPEGRDRLRYEYGRCPRCNLIVALAGGSRCGLCKDHIEAGEGWPLDFRHSCPHCDARVCAPLDAALLGCPSCGGFFFDFRHPYPNCKKTTDGLYGEVGPCKLFLGHSSPCSMYETAEEAREYGPTQVPEEWIDRSRPLPDAFVDALTEAVRGVVGSREQRVVALRYGLDGMPGRTFRQIGEDLERSSSVARSLHGRALHRVRLAPLRPNREWSPERRTCAIVVHLATEVLGDVTDARAPARVRAFIDEALPNVRVQVATQLLIKLACLDLDVLRGGRDQALCRAAVAVRRT